MTDRGRIRAPRVLVATNATADAFLPKLRRRVLPVGSFIVATEVLDPELARSVAPTGRMMVDTKNLLFYWRMTPDGRLAFGGRRSLAPSTVAQAADFLYDAMVTIHPQLADTAIDAAWGGEVAMTLDRMPHVGQVGSTWYATGCNGSGVALMPWLGARMAAVLLDEESPPSFAELNHRPIPASGCATCGCPSPGSGSSGRTAGPEPRPDAPGISPRAGGRSEGPGRATPGP